MSDDVVCCFRVSPKIRTDDLGSVTPTTTHIEQEQKNAPARSPRSPYFCIAKLLAKRRRHVEQFDSSNVCRVIAKKSLPALQRRTASAFHALGDSRPSDVDITLCNSMNTRRLKSGPRLQVGHPVAATSSARIRRKLIRCQRHKVSRFKKMNDGTERVTGWPRMTFAQSAQDVENLGSSAISECRCASKSKVQRETLAQLPVS